MDDNMTFPGASPHSPMFRNPDAKKSETCPPRRTATPGSVPTETLVQLGKHNHKIALPTYAFINLVDVERKEERYRVKNQECFVWLMSGSGAFPPTVVLSPDKMSVVITYDSKKFYCPKFMAGH